LSADSRGGEAFSTIKPRPGLLSLAGCPGGYFVWFPPIAGGSLSFCVIVRMADAIAPDRQASQQQNIKKTPGYCHFLPAFFKDVGLPSPNPGQLPARAFFPFFGLFGNSNW